MFKLLSILNSVILVSSNPLQGATCPLASYQPNYVSEVPVSTNFNPYQQQNTVQYRLTPSIQTVPYSYNGQVNGYYLDNRLTNAHTSHVINPISTYNQDGLNTNYYSSNTNKIPKVVNNYIIVPADTVKVNQGNANAIQSRDVNKNYRYVKDNNCKGNNKCKREENCELRDTYNNYKNKPIDLKCDNKIQNQIRSENEVNNNKRKSSKKGDNSKQPKFSKRKKILNVDENRKDDIKESNAKRKSNKKSNKKKRVKQRAKTEEESVSNDRAVSMKTDEGIFMRDEGKCEKKTADVEVCFDINEECTCLENRKPRNNCYEPNTNYQPYLPSGLPENVMSYLNNVMSNPQFRQNYLSSFGNLPYNYDYLYQIPQVYNSCPNESSKRGKIRRKSSKSNKNSRNRSNNKGTTKKQNENIGHQRKEISNACKVVELEPQFINVEETKLNVQETQDVEVSNKEIVNEAEIKNIQEETIEAPEILGNTDWVQTTADDHSSEVYMAPVGDDDVPDAVPELPDEYYPDFTSDKIYSSKEEYEFNFHDRHYYDSDNKAEMSIESRKYEHVDGKHSKHINDVTDAIIEHDQNKQKNNHKNVASKELEFRTPPPLLFPDFKTEMIHKDSFTARNKQELDSEENYSNNHHYQNPFYDQKDQKPIDLGHKKGIETVFARSKVIKYGTKTKEEISSVSKEMRNDDKNLFSTDGRTTVIIAKSLSYPEDY